MGFFRRRSATDLPPPAYSNEAVISRIESEEGVGRQTARAWFGEMLVFLDLCAQSDKVLSPPTDVDKAWHAFLLHSRDYEAYCNERFGKVIHHQPSDAPDPEAYRRAYKRRRKYDSGASANAAIWPLPAGTTDDDYDSAGGGSGGGDSGSGDSSSGDSGGSSCGGGGCGGGS